MGTNLLVVCELDGSRLRHVSLEMVTCAQQLFPGAVTALVIGNVADGAGAELGRFGADSVVILDGPEFLSYSTDGFAAAVCQVAQAVEANILFFPASAFGKDLAPRVAGLLDAGLATDCTEVRIGEDGLTAVRPVYAGKAWQRVRVTTSVACFSIRPNVMQAQELGRAGTLRPVVVNLDPTTFKAVVTETQQQGSGGRVELTEAAIVVSGGRGIKAPENFRLLDALAEELGAAVGSSRPVADDGWVPHSYHVGQTGKVVSPTVYFAIGISGAIQHLAGISGSKCIVAVNNDPEAPIFKVANYGIVGDLFQVVPALTQAVREMKANE